jgi:hypothetical protein
MKQTYHYQDVLRVNIMQPGALILSPRLTNPLETKYKLSLGFYDCCIV